MSAARSTNRTVQWLVLGILALIGPGRAQEGAKPAAPASQSDAIDKIVTAIQAAEKELESARIELATTGHLANGLGVQTRGVLHVLRGAQPALHTLVEVSFGDGITGLMEAAQTANGITMYEESPAAGELYLHFDASRVADLEWAGTVLDAAMLPGMSDRRAQTPLGSSMVVDLKRHFDLKVEPRTNRNGEAGEWLAGKRRVGLEDADPELPQADRVELFVRQRDHALIEVKHLQGDKVLQHLVVNKLEIGLELPPAKFTVDGRGQPLRDVGQYQPMSTQIEKVLLQAEAQSAEGVVRPSKRK